MRNDDSTWTLTEAAGLAATLSLPSLGIEICRGEVFDKGDFSAAEEDA